MEVIIALLFLVAFFNWREEKHRHRDQICGICHRWIHWIGTRRSPTGWTHRGGQIREAFPGLDRVMLGIEVTHPAVTGGMNLGEDEVLDFPLF